MPEEIPRPAPWTDEPRRQEAEEREAKAKKERASAERARRRAEAPFAHHEVREPPAREVPPVFIMFLVEKRLEIILKKSLYP